MVKRLFFLKRETYGHVNLLQELRVNEPEDFRNFLRMDAPSFDELLGLVEPLIKKEDTVMRPSISPSERLSITLRYLASGNSFWRLEIPDSKISASDWKVSYWNLRGHHPLSEASADYKGKHVLFVKLYYYTKAMTIKMNWENVLSVNLYYYNKVMNIKINWQLKGSFSLIHNHEISE